MPFSDLDRTVTEQLRHAVERNALEQKEHGERVAKNDEGGPDPIPWTG